MLAEQVRGTAVLLFCDQIKDCNVLRCGFLARDTALRVFTFFKLLRKQDTRESTLKAGLIANPDLVFMGLPIMTQLLGPASIFPILVANFLLSLILVPLTTVLLTIGSEGAKEQERGVFVKALTKFLREPRVWVPTLGALLVLAKVQTPAAVIHLLDKMGEPTTGISLFVVGLIIAAEEVKLTASIAWNVGFKNILQPNLMYLIVLTFGIKGSLAREAILLMALPTGVNMAMFAEEFDTLVTECSTTVLVTRLMVSVTIPVLIAVTAHMQ